MSLYKLILFLLSIFNCYSISSSQIMQTLTSTFGQMVTSFNITQFIDFTKSHAKQYTSASIAKYRQQIFNKNVKKVQTLNSSPNNSYPQGMTIYSDLTEEEFQKLILNPRLQSTPDAMLKFPGFPSPTVAKKQIIGNSLDQTVTSKIRISAGSSSTTASSNSAAVKINSTTTPPAAPTPAAAATKASNLKYPSETRYSYSSSNNYQTQSQSQAPQYQSQYQNSYQSQSQSPSSSNSFSFNNFNPSSSSSSSTGSPSSSSTTPNSSSSAQSTASKTSQSSSSQSSPNPSSIFPIIAEKIWNQITSNNNNAIVQKNEYIGQKNEAVAKTEADEAKAKADETKAKQEAKAKAEQAKAKAIVQAINSTANKINVNATIATNTTVNVNGNSQSSSSKTQINNGTITVVNNTTPEPTPIPTPTTNTAFKSKQSKIQISTSSPAIDWRRDKKVSRVKMQGSCGNCYSFSTTGALQSAYMIKHNTVNVTYSQQQITDCCGAGGFGCNGCQGGWQWQALRYIQKNGIVTQQQYQTTSSDSGVAGDCQKIYSPQKILNDKTPFIALASGNITALYEAVSKQPVSVGIDASFMQFVLSEDSTEIFSNCSSNPEDANHAMLVVGFDQDGNWILKNSWGEYWGDGGYIKIKAGNTCGISNFALYPVLN